MIDVENVLAELVIPYETRGREAISLCPMHRERTGKEDHSPSWSINLETGAHMCFSCHYKGSIMQLICDVEGFYLDTWGVQEYDYTAAKAWLSRIQDVNPDKLAMILSRIPSRVEQYVAPIPMSEARLAVFVDPPVEELEGRKISLEAAQHYGILWDPRKFEWILPTREPGTNKLLGWQEKGTVKRTFRNHPAGLKMSSTVFGVNTVGDGDIVLVESPLDCARMRTAGVDNVVAICGSNMSEDQFKLVRYADRVIAAFDNPKIDTAGKSASESLRKLAFKYGANLLFFNYGETGKKDPGDLTDNEIVWGLAHAQSALLGEKAYV
jgi:hypothetical protein